MDAYARPPTSLVSRQHTRRLHIDLLVSALVSKHLWNVRALMYGSILPDGAGKEFAQGCRMRRAEERFYERLTTWLSQNGPHVESRLMYE
jgi:hypothetical protein